MLAIGSQAPDLEIQTHLGFKGPLRALWEEGPLVLFFYPKDDTRICTAQACTLESKLAEFGKIGVNVLGVSLGNLKSKQRFASKHNLNFPLAVDEKGEIVRAFQSMRSLLIMNLPKRITYVIGSDGLIKGRVHQEFNVGDHLNMIWNTLDQLKSAS